MKRAPLLLILACACLLTPFARAWDWKLPNQRFQRLTKFEQRQYQKGEELFQKKQYKEAALAFEKFVLSFDTSTEVGQAMFMQAYSKQMGLKRNEAIKTYWEIIDYWPDDVDLAAAAMYQVGVCHLDNGDIKDGLKVFAQLAKHPKYRNHELTANALQALAENERKNQSLPRAYHYWQQIYEDFYATNRNLANNSRDELVRYYVKDGAWARIEALVAKHNWEEPAGNIGYWNYLHQQADKVFGSKEFYPPTEARERKRDANKFLEYFGKGLPAYQQANQRWEYLRRALDFALSHAEDREVWQPYSEQAMALNDDRVTRQVMGLLIRGGHYELALPLLKQVKNITDDLVTDVMNQLMRKKQYDAALPLLGLLKDKQAFYPDLFDQLLKAGRYDHAAHVNGQIEDARLARWNDYRLAASQSQWEDAIKILKEISGADADRAKQANNALVDIYMKKVRQFDEAIKLLRVMNDPPRTAFLIAECYRSQNDLKRAAATFQEIENFFPEVAPQAAWQRATMYHGIGAVDKAIAEYRRILKVYPRSSQSSKAHEKLEALGIKTGGGVVNDD